MEYSGTPARSARRPTASPALDFFPPRHKKTTIRKDMPMGRCHTLAGVAEPTPLGCARRGCLLRECGGRLRFISPYRLLWSPSDLGVAIGVV